MENANSKEYLEKIKTQVIENLKRTAFAPSVQMTDVPRDPEGFNDEADAILDDLDEDENKDSRFTKRRWDKYVEKDGELSESEDEEENERNGVRKQAGQPKRRNLMDFQNVNAVADMDSAIASPERNGTPNVEAGIVPTAISKADGEKITSAMSSAEVTPLQVATEGSPTNGSSVMSHLPIAALDNDGDVDMDTEAVGSQTITTAMLSSTQVTTPPLSPEAVGGASLVTQAPTPATSHAPTSAVYNEDEEMNDQGHDAKPLSSRTEEAGVETPVEPKTEPEAEERKQEVEAKEALQAKAEDVEGGLPADGTS